MRRFLLTLFLVLIVPATDLYAQYGKIRGIVRDAETNEPVFGASVLIDGTLKGDATDFDGEYIIIGVLPGVYDLKVSYLGYKTTFIRDVKVSIDLTTQIDISLEQETIEGEEVEIVAQRPLVQRDVTATLSSVSAEEIKAIPVENFSEIVELQAGVVDGHFRGGRTGEVGYWVDGVPVTDVFNGSLSAGIENSSIQEVQVVTGAFNAEYGQAMSGIVNVVTKDGGDKLTGNVEMFSGDYMSNRTDLFMNIDRLNPVSVRNANISLDGPIVKEKLTFFAGVRYFENDGWHYGRNVYDFTDVGFNSLGQLDLLNPGGSGDSSLVSMNPFEKINGQLKLTWKLTSLFRISANVLYGVENFRNYSHDARLMPQFSRDESTESMNLYVKATHSLSNNTFYDLSVSRTFKSYDSFLFEDPYDSRYLPNNYAGHRANNFALNFLVGGTDNGRYSRTTDTYIAKFDITSQVDSRNQMKAGVEYRQHNLETLDQVSIVNSVGEGVIDVFTNSQLDVQPIEFSAYVQDKLEIGDLIINGGVRVDYFDSRFKAFVDPTDPSVVFTEQRPEDESLVFKDSEPTFQVSPRLGIAFPISESGVVHFSYGHFFQIPNFELLYQNPLFRLNSGGSGLIGLLGNANLKPQKTINGELGYKQEIGRSTGIEITAYFRDIRNLAGTATEPYVIQGTSARYGIIQNSDFGFVKGLVLAVDQRFESGLSMTADYTFQIAKGNASDPAQAYNAAAAKTELEKRIVPLDWDQLHTVNMTASYMTKNGWGFGLIFSGGSGFPYTPDYNLRTNTSPPSVNPLNSQRRPARFNLDLNLTREVRFSKSSSAQLYVKVDNLLDYGNELGVFGDTGRATYSLYKNEDRKTFIGPEAYLDSYYTRSGFYNEPRRMVVGLRYSF